MEELYVPRIFGHFKGLDDKTWGSVSCVVKDSLKVCPVRDSAVGLRFRILVLELGEVLEYLLCCLELSCHKAGSWHRYEHISSPVLVEPRESCIYSLSLLLCDKLVHCDGYPVQGVVQRREVGLDAVIFSYQAVDPFPSFPCHRPAFLSEFLGKRKTFIFSAIGQDESF